MQSNSESEFSSEELKRAANCQIRHQEAHNKEVELRCHLMALAEIRVGIGMATADKDKSSIGDSVAHPMERAFNEINSGRLQNRYIKLVDMMIKEHFDPTYNGSKD